MAAGFYRPASVARFEGAARRAGQGRRCSSVGRRLAVDHGGVGLHEDPAERRRHLRDGGHRRPPVRHRQPAHRLRPPRARAAGVVLALGRPLAEHLLHGELHRRAGGGGEEGPVRVPPRACSASSRATRRCSKLAAEKAGWGKPLPAGVFRGIAVAQSFGSYVAEVAEVSVGGRRHAEGAPRRRRGRLRHDGQPARSSRARSRARSSTACRRRCTARSPSRTAASSRATSTTTRCCA